jgi:peptidoglycan/LPS O-acetylase OafA/YrhL
VLCTSALIIALQSKGIVRRVLSNPVLVYVGTISYAIYLIHLSVLYAVWPLGLNRYLSAALALVITLAYASITWFAFERRLIHGPARPRAHTQAAPDANQPGRAQGRTQGSTQGRA